ncbi:MAG: GAF domain-containing protein [Pseudomonadota bacterium]
MSLVLADLGACFEGVIPSILCTVGADGTPNISYLSHVARLDDAHVALSDQFFSKTAANMCENPHAALLVVNPHDGAQYRLDLQYRETIDRGPVFERMAAELRATSAQLGMTDAMRLRGLSVHRVLRLSAVRSPLGAPSPTAAGDRALPRLAQVVDAFVDKTDLGEIVDAALDALDGAFHPGGTMILLHDPARNCFVTLGSRGYGRTGIGADVPLGDGLIGLAGQERRAIRVSDASRLRRLGAAVETSSEQENRTRSVALPSLPDGMSQIALPMMAHGRTRGVLFLESTRRLAFSAEDEIALALVARQLAAAIALSEADPGDVAMEAAVPAPPPIEASTQFRVAHHAHDDSVFIGHEYLIKGVPGRLLMHMLDAFLDAGQVDFSNREIRAEDALRLPGLKDNLETRLLLLRRRLEEKNAPIRLSHPSRGRIRLHVVGQPIVKSDRKAATR